MDNIILERLKKQLEEFIANPDSHAFNDVVRNSIETLDMTHREVADEFECAPTTIGRWMKGTARPMSGVKRFVCKYFLNKVNEKLNGN